MKEIHPSDSNEQRQIEGIVIKLLEKRFDCQLISNPIVLDKSKNITVNLDAYNLQKGIIIEIYAGIETLKSAQLKKVITDGFKLTLIEKMLFQNQKCRKIICFIDQTILSNFNSNNWHSLAFKEFNIETIFEKISPKDLQSLKNAKERQYR